MKKIVFLLLSICWAGISGAQNNLTCTYDAAGNRVKREPAQAVPRPLSATTDSSGKTTAPQEAAGRSLQQQPAENAPAFEVRLFPNPTLGMLTLELPELKAGETGEITVHSQMGALVFRQQRVTAIQTIYLSGLLPGYYAVRITVGNKVVVKGIIKQ
jgi:hypothetical protein